MHDWLIARVEKALEHGLGTHTFSDVAKALAEGEMQIFFNEAAVCITEIKQAPRKRYLSIFLVAGRLSELKELEPQIIQFGRDQNCDFVAGCGRLGWQKVATPGWKKRWVVHSFDLN
jgi:hypothetical protein